MRRSAGFGLALGSAASFGTSGTIATGLLKAGWSPGAAVTARVTLATLALTAPAVWQLRGRWRQVWAEGRTLLLYGVAAVAGAQLCYFNAVQHVSVAVALLLEYSGILLVVGWQWLRHGHRPGRLTVLGALTAAAGLVLVLDLLGAQHLDGIGVLWGLGAAVGLAVYFVLSAGRAESLPPLATAWAGLGVGAVGLGLAAAVGLLPLRTTARPVPLGGYALPWWSAVAGLAFVAAALPYATGVAAVRRLGARLASFVGLAEVLFAALFAWILLGQALSPVQLCGAALVIAGIALVRAGEPPAPDAEEATARAVRGRRAPAPTVEPEAQAGQPAERPGPAVRVT